MHYIEFPNEQTVSHSPTLNACESAIVRNADWFIARQKNEGTIDAEGDEFYGLRGDATLVGHSVTVRCLAAALTGNQDYLDSAYRSLEWLSARQDPDGGWRRHSAFTLDGAQCVFEGFNTWRRITSDTSFNEVLEKAASRMVRGIIGPRGELLLPDIIELGEYAHFALLAWKTTGAVRFREVGETILAHISRNFNDDEGFWLPFDKNSLRYDLLARLARPPLRFATSHFPMRGRLMAKLASHLAPLVVGETRPQYAMSLMDAEALIDTLDGQCDFPELRRQTRRAIDWAEKHCSGPFPGCLVESRSMAGKPPVYPVPILNDTRQAALWPTTCFLIALCGLNDENLRDKAQQTADWILSIQDSSGGFSNFQTPDGSLSSLQSGNVNYYAVIALWLFYEVYGSPRVRLFTNHEER